MPAVGLGFGDVIIGELLKAKGKVGKGAEKIDYAIGYLEEGQYAMAIDAARSLRESGKSVDRALRPEKAKHFFARVGRGGIRRAIFIGPDDIRQGVLRVKDLKERTEHSLPVTDLVR